MLKRFQDSTCRALPLPAAAPFILSMPSGPYWSYSARDCGSESTSAPQHPSQCPRRVALLTMEQRSCHPSLAVRRQKAL